MCSHANLDSHFLCVCNRPYSSMMTVSAVCSREFRYPYHCASVHYMKYSGLSNVRALDPLWSWDHSSFQRPTEHSRASWISTVTALCRHKKDTRDGHCVVYPSCVSHCVLMPLRFRQSLVDTSFLWLTVTGVWANCKTHFEDLRRFHGMCVLTRFCNQGGDAGSLACFDVSLRVTNVDVESSSIHVSVCI